MKKWMKFLMASASMLLLVSIISSPASALPGGRALQHGYFTDNYAANSGPPYYSKVLEGGLYGVSTSGPTMKSTLISVITGDLASTAQNKTGAQFIIQLMRGGIDHGRPTAHEVTDWKNRINSSTISMVYTPSQSYNGYNSGYQCLYPDSSFSSCTLSADDDAFYAASGTQPAFDFYYTDPATNVKSLVFILKVECGNPLGDYPSGLPGGSGWTLTGTSAVSTPTANEGDTVNFAHSVTNNGPATATYCYTIQKKYPSDAGYVTLVSCTNATTTSGGSVSEGNALTSADTATPGDYCQRVAYTNSGGPSTATGYSTAVCTHIKFPPTCTATTAPGRVEPGEHFDLVDNLVFNDYPATSVVLTFESTPSQSSGSLPAGGAGGSFPLDDVLAPLVPENYVLDADMYSGSVKVYTCHTTVPVTALPYFKVFGSSISAEGDFATDDPTCTTSGSGEIGGWNDNSGTYDRGAGTDYAALAALHIDGFGTTQRQISTSGLQAPPDTLSIANDTTSEVAATSTDAFSPTLGGNYAPGNAFCLTSEGTPTFSTPEASGGSITMPSSSGAYSYPSSVSIMGPSTIGQGPAPKYLGNQVGLYVNGDAYIDGNIIFAGSGSWADSTQIPSFVLVATGNIYIDPGVTELDGLYISQSKSSGVGGQIYTCATASGAIPATAAYSVCHNQLKVYGSFVAKQVNLERSYGSLINSVSGERPVEYGKPNLTCSDNSTTDTSNSTCAAEVFDFSPEFYLSLPSNKSVQPPSNGILPYDSVTSLPPIL